MDPGKFLSFWGATSLYGVALLLYLRWFRSGDRVHGEVASWALRAAALLHVFGLALLGVTRGFAPPTGTGESLSLVSAATAVLYLYLESRGKERGLGPFALVVVLPLMIKASQIGPELVVPKELRDNFFGPHATAVTLAMSGFTISAFLSLAYLAVYRQLRHRRIGLLVQRLPSLQGLDVMTRQATRAGFIFLTLGLIFGAVLAQHVWGEAWSWDPKQCMTLLTWLLYGAALALRRRRDWQGERIAAVNLVAFSSVILGAVLLYAFFETMHRFGGTAP